MKTRDFVFACLALAITWPAPAEAQDPNPVCVDPYRGCGSETPSAPRIDTSRADAEAARQRASEASATFRRGMAARNRGDARAAYQLIRRAAELDPGNSEYARALETARRVYLDSTANARAAANSRVNDTSTGAARQAQQARDEIETAPKQTDEILKGASARPFDTTSNLAPTAPVVVFSKEPADLGPALAPHLGIALNLNDPKNQPVVEALQGVAYMLQVVRTSAVSGVRVDPAMLTQRVQKLNAALRKAEVPTVTTGQVEEAYSSYRLGVAEAPPDTPAGGTSQRNGQPQ